MSLRQPILAHEIFGNEPPYGPAYLGSRGTETCFWAKQGLTLTVKEHRTFQLEELRQREIVETLPENYARFLPDEGE